MNRALDHSIATRDFTEAGSVELESRATGDREEIGLDILRHHVERIVRPIDANYRRKDEMREELLGHLINLFEAGLAGGAAPRDAAEGAIARFGDPRKIRRELQETVPWPERLLFFRIHLPLGIAQTEPVRRTLDLLKAYESRRTDETDLAHAVRAAYSFAAIFCLFSAFLLSCVVLWRAWRGYGFDLIPFVVVFGIASGVAMTLACFLFVLLGHRFHRALERQFWGEGSWLVSVGYGVWMAAALLVSGLLFWTLVRPNLAVTAADLRLLILLSVAVPFILFALMRVGLAEFRRFGDWSDMEEREEGHAPRVTSRNDSSPGED